MFQDSMTESPSLRSDHSTSSTRTILIFLACLTAMGTMIAAARRNQASLSTLALFPPSLTVDEDARWDAGWASLCERSPDLPPTLVTPRDRPSLWFRALALIDTGHFEAALPLFQRLAEAGDDAESAQAYVAALGMDWEVAIERYPKPIAARHRRFWGTIAYLAAQGRYFAGDHAGAGPLYQMADAAYDIQGPLTSLAMVDCLTAANRPIEAFDAYRRALSVMAPDEAMSHRAPFDQARLDGLEAWHHAVPTNDRVAHWLTYYQQRAAGGAESSGTLFGGEGTGIAELRIAPEDVETGPFLQLHSADDEASTSTRVNLAPNGAFAWDASPDGVRPFGWHERMYGGQGTIFFDEEEDKRWLCFDTYGIVGGSGVQSIRRPVTSANSYTQGALVFGEHNRPVIGRMWYVAGEQQYSYAEQIRAATPIISLVGTWIPPTPINELQLWLVLSQENRGCLTDVFFVDLP